MSEEEYIKSEGIKVVVKDFPHGIKGFCYYDEDGTNYIAVNSRYTKEQQQQTFLHELNHIQNGELNDLDYKEYG